MQRHLEIHNTKRLKYHLKIISKILLLASLFVLTGCTSTAKVSNDVSVAKDIVEESEFLFFKNNSADSFLGDLYLQKGTNEKEKVSSDVFQDSYKYLPNKKMVIFLTEDGLFVKENEKERELISVDCSSDFKVLGDESGVLFLRIDKSELYLKKWNQEKEKIGSEVTSYKATNDGKRIFFTTSNNELFLKDDGLEKEKIASNVDFFYLSDNGQTMCYLTLDKTLYMRDFTNGDNIKLTSGDIYYDVRITSEGELITYLNEFNYEKYKGELYYIKNNRELKKVASDVTEYQVFDNGEKIYYLNEDSNLMAYDILKDEKRNLSTDVSSFFVSTDGDKILFKTSENSTYLISSKEEKLKLGDDLIKVDFIENSIMYLTESNELFTYEIGSEKQIISANVKNYCISDLNNSLAYYTDDYKLFFKPINKDAININDSLREFNTVVYSGELVFEKSLIIDDIVGIWDGYYDMAEEPFELTLEITNDNKIKVYDDGILQFESPIEFNGYDMMGSLLIKNDPDYYLKGINDIHVVYYNESSINLDGGGFIRIDRTQLDNKLQQQKIAIEEEIRAQEEALAKQKKIDEAQSLANNLIYTDQVSSVEGANFRDTPSIDGNKIGELIVGREFYIYDTFVDEDARIWCYIGAMNNNNRVVYGWTAYSNFSEPKNTISDTQAEELVRSYLKENGLYIPEYIISDHMDGNKYVVQCYDIAGEMTRTSGWYYVDKISGYVESMEF